MILNMNIMTSEHPDRAKCYEILTEYGTPQHVVEHCKSVAAVAYRLGEALNRSRKEQLNLELILSAGLLHDMARVEYDHGNVAADWCRDNGYCREAEIICAHMFHEFPEDVSELTETDLVCLGDRLSLEDRYVGLDERMDYVIRKGEKNGWKDARKIILEKKAVTRRLLDGIECCIGMTIDDLMQNLDYEDIEKRYGKDR